MGLIREIGTEMRCKWLTNKIRGHYSASMLEQLDTLEAKLQLLLDRYRLAREENLQLRQRVLAMEKANRQLSERLSAASTRMESLFEQIP